MRLSIHPAAEQDIREAAAFYEREGSALVAARFIAEFKRLTTLLAEQPLLGAPRAHGRRGFSMRVFPYTVIYRVAEEELTVLVVKHDSRHPSHGATRT